MLKAYVKELPGPRDFQYQSIKSPMYFETVMMTPDYAKFLLQFNFEKNRKIRENAVKKLKVALIKKEWILTHQGIAITADGKLIDGQHRLVAIAETGISAPMVIAWNVDEIAYYATDHGKPRVNADTLALPPRLVAAANMVAIFYTGGKDFGMSAQSLEPWVELIRDSWELLNKVPKQTVRRWTTRPIQGALCVLMLNGQNLDYIIRMYSGLVGDNHTGLTPLVDSFRRQHEDTKTKRTEMEIFLRAIRAFDYNGRDTTKVEVKKYDELQAQTKERIQYAIDHPKKPKLVP